MATTVRLPDPPAEYSQEYMARMLNQVNLQFRALGSIGNQQQLVLDTRHAAPDKIEDGMLVKADGTDWNPGAGSGVYVYRDAAWHFLG